MGVILGGGYTCSNCGQYHRTSVACSCSKGIPRIKNRTSVCLYSIHGKLVKCYDSATEAVKETGTPMSSIFANIKGSYKTTKSGIWKLKN